MHGELFKKTLSHSLSLGFALNINNDLSYFDSIIPCGLENMQVTSISKELGRELQIRDMIPHVLDSFAEIFQTNLILQDSPTHPLPKSST
jgi:lipoate-protein ligase B